MAVAAAVQTLVDRRAPAAPADVRTMAAELLEATLTTANQGTVSFQGRSVTYRTLPADVWARSGAAALLAPYRQRKGIAPVVEDA